MFDWTLDALVFHEHSSSIFPKIRKFHSYNTSWQLLLIVRLLEIGDKRCFGFLFDVSE